MFSNELASKLINLPKVIEGRVTTLNLKDDKTRLILINEDEPEYNFLFEVTSHTKISFKISLHNQEDNTKQGLMRIDYRGGHKNPEVITDFVPEIAKLYVGHFFQNEPHIHLYAEGFKNLAWAIPLTTYNFSVPNINSNQNFIEAIYAFAKQINIVTPISIQNSLL